MEQGTADLGEMFEALQDEVNLVKTEIKQTLVDLREFMAKEQTLFPQVAYGRRTEPQGPAVEEQEIFPLPPVPDVRRAQPIAAPRGQPDGSGGLDVFMLGNLIWWLGTMKRRGLSLQTVSPFLEAYEMAGYITPTMSKLVLRSMADLDQMEGSSPGRAFAPQDYSECLRQLHYIICIPEYTVEQISPPPEVQPQVSMPPVPQSPTEEEDEPRQRKKTKTSSLKRP